MIVFLFEDVASEYSSSILRAADSSRDMIELRNFVREFCGVRIRNILRIHDRRDPS